MNCVKNKIIVEGFWNMGKTSLIKKMSKEFGHKIICEPNHLEKNIKTGIKKYFAQKNDYRIIFTTDFNIPLKSVVPQNFKLNYWNNLGLPLTHNSVQALQPIVFVSRKKVRFKDSIKLI